MTSSRTLAVLFCVYAAIAVPMIAVLMPPFQAADELAHVERAEQISLGVPIAGRSVDRMSAGGIGYGGFRQLWLAFDPIRFHPAVKVDARMKVAETIGWGNRGWKDFPNTAIYPPFLYLPASTGLLIGHVAHLSVWHSLLTARLLSGFISIVIAALAIALAGGGAPIVFTVLCLPMSLALFGAVTQDGPMIACAALASVLLARPRVVSGGYWLGCVLLTLVAMARPTYIPLCLAPLMIPGRTLPSKIVGAGLASAATIGWVMLTGRLTMPVLASQHMTLQIDAIRHHPRILPLIYSTLRKEWVDGLPVGREFVGVLGWLDTPLPNLYYVAAGLTLILALMISRPCAVYVPRGRVLFFVLIAVATTCAIYASEYLSWSEIGSTLIDGVQGRYFLPVAPFLMLVLPGSRTDPFHPSLLRQIRHVISAFPAVSIGLTLYVIHARYYFGG